MDLDRWGHLSKYDGLSKAVTLNCESCSFYLEINGAPGVRHDYRVCNWGKHLTLLFDRDKHKKCGLNVNESPNVIVVEGESGLRRNREDIVAMLAKLEDLERKRDRREQKLLAKKQQLQFYFPEERRNWF